MGLPCALVVEDDPPVAMLLRFILEREGFRVEHAADGEQARRLIQSIPPPSVALLDVLIPHGSGFELVGLIRRSPGWENVAVLILSAKGGERDIAQALDAGADDYLVKPFQPDEFKARLRRHLRGHR